MLTCEIFCHIQSSFITFHDIQYGNDKAVSLFDPSHTFKQRNTKSPHSDIAADQVTLEASC